jgi:hypothetical protein
MYFKDLKVFGSPFWARLQKDYEKTASFVIFVPAVRPHGWLGSQWTDLREILCIFF